MSKMKHHHAQFVNAVVEAAKAHEKAASDFVLVKKDDLHAVFGEANPEKKAASVCILWGVDPMTGQPVCLQWS